MTGGADPDDTPDTAAEVKEQAALRLVGEALSARYADVDPTQVVEAVEQARSALAGAPIRDFVPVLVERRARELLDNDRD